MSGDLTGLCLYIYRNARPFCLGSVTQKIWNSVYLYYSANLGKFNYISILIQNHLSNCFWNYSRLKLPQSLRLNIHLHKNCEKQFFIVFNKLWSIFRYISFSTLTFATHIINLWPSLFLPKWSFTPLLLSWLSN